MHRREKDLGIFWVFFFLFYQINAEESFFCGIGRRNTSLVDGILTVSREQYEATEMMKWDVNVTQTIAYGDHPSGADPFKHKRDKNNNVHGEQTCTAADITVSSFPLPVMGHHIFSTSVTFMHTHMLSRARQNSVFHRALAKESGRFLVYAAVSSYAISYLASRLNAIEQLYISWTAFVEKTIAAFTLQGLMHRSDLLTISDFVSHQFN